MRIDKPRVAPLAESELGDEHRAMLGDRFRSGKILNIFRTLIKAPRAYKAFMWWGGYILSDHNDLPAREREMIILRTGFNWKAGYEWAQHVRIGKDCGLTDEEIERIKAGPDAAGWTPLEQAMLQATDELTAGGHVSDATWDALGDLTEKQRMDLIMTVGQYTQVSMMLNSFGVQLDDDLVLDHDLKA
ncbi:MAG: carboxymuconolactone decarboxylase family protein [Parasphingorhabdus sp.]|uniref:carboxymuconolactone decarboxylase family protein n=2 Tax=Parasphingorhabdus sp. TaxID=2709688 RepID=UPI00326501A2